MPWVSKEFGAYFPTIKDLQGPFISKPGESILSILKKDQLFEIVNDSDFKGMSDMSIRKRMVQRIV